MSNELKENKSFEKEQKNKSTNKPNIFDQFSYSNKLPKPLYGKKEWTWRNK